MTGADGRIDDAVRQRCLRETGLLDGGAHPSLDRLARAAAHQLRAELALVSLVTADRRVVAGRAGPVPAHSFCRLVVDTEAPVLVCDARTDERFFGHPAVADGVIAYAGFPLRSADGYVLGAFCVIDGQAREWEPRELLLIEDLAAAAETEIALRAANLTSVVTAHQLTEQREQLLADQQAQNRRLRQLDRLKDELVALVSHELRNPLGAIHGYLETLLGDPSLDPGQRRLAEVIDRRRGQMQALVDDLLDAAKLDAGRLDIDSRSTSAIELIRDVVAAQRPSATAQGLTVTVSAPDELKVTADPVRLRQVLDNLLGNAIKYTPAGGAVTVTGRASPPEGVVVVTVSDTGIGIPAEEYPGLFERFFRASNAIEGGIKGTGLGLAITKAIVDAHGGSLTAEPRPAGGTIFTVVLPI